MLIDRDRHVRRDGPEDYLPPFLNLFPQGLAWPRDPPDNVFLQTCRGLQKIWGYDDGRAADLLERESDPRKTTDVSLPDSADKYQDPPIRDGLLPEWEKAWGLPDPCFPTATTIDERRRMLLLVMTMLGAQSRAWFEWVADWIGFEISFREWAPFMAGVSQVGETRPLKPTVGESKTSVEIVNSVDVTFEMNREDQIVGYERPSLNFQTGMRVRATAIADLTMWVEGIIVSYGLPRARTLVVHVDTVSGSGTYDDWTVVIVSPNSPVVDDTQGYRWEIGPPEMRFYWSVQPGVAGVVWFRAASGQSGVDPHVRVMTPLDLACLFRRWKPAHTELVFDYSSLAAGGPMQGTP